MENNNRILNGQLLPLSDKPNCVSTQTNDSSKKMNPLPFMGTTIETKEKISAILQSIDRMYIETESIQYIHAIEKSKLFKFKDDVEFLLDEQNKMVHFRSASRVGHSDLGVNRKRMEKITALYLEEK